MNIEEIKNKIICGDCIEVMKTLPDNSIDAIVTDPPYGLEFMGKDWDKFSNGNLSNLWQQAGKPSMEKFEGKNDWHSTPKPRYLNNIKSMLNFQQFSYNWAKECLRVLKPGGYLLAFGGTRTYHRMVCGIEDAGFEIRDTIGWCFGSGFPKSLNIGKVLDKFLKTGNASWNGTGDSSNGALGYSKLQYQQGYRPEDYSNRHKNKEEITEEQSKQWEGWGTALKPAWESIVMARKPLSEKTVAENVLKWGTGGINIDGCRIGTSEKIDSVKNDFSQRTVTITNNQTPDWEQNSLGRFPSNFIHDGSEEVLELFPDNKGAIAKVKSGQKGFGGVIYGKYKTSGDDGKTFYDKGKLGGASRFFYCAKASKSERNEGLEDFEEKENPITNQSWKCAICNKFQLQGNGDICRCENPKWIIPKAKNNHPTVKPIKLMQYLCRLVTPKNGIVLDPFAGSGSTCIGALKEGFNFIGIEKEEEYVKIAEARIKPYLEQRKL